ncbi:MAG: endonuclease [Gemmataceae bacterium]|nr:endonuclease [Gemmataceae bacterium]
MGEATKLLVRARAGNRCEYCHSHQDDEPFFRFQVEHIIAKQHGGGDEDTNLALACPHCNLHKGPNLAGLDPFGDALTPLFNPREQRWEEDFAHRGPLIMGQTAVGRATVRVLNMNDRIRLELRVSVQARTS